MRTFLLGAAALMAVAAPGVAAAQTGYVGLDYSSVDVDGADTEDAFGVSGAVVVTDNFAVDAGISDNDSETAWGATGHLYMNNDQHLLGVFLGVSDADDTTVWNGGVEGQLYVGPNTTLAGAVSYARDDDSDVSATGANAEGRYFFNDNFRAEAGVGWFNVDTPLGDDNALTLGAGGEFQFTGAPVSVGLGYTRIAFDETDVEADVVSATLRWNFGGGSLHDRDRTGAALAGLSGAGSALGL